MDTNQKVIHMCVQRTTCLPTHEPHMIELNNKYSEEGRVQMLLFNRTVFYGRKEREGGINGELSSPNRVFLARVTEGLGPRQGGAFL